VSPPKIAKNSLKPPILGVEGRSRSLMLVPMESSSAVLVKMSSKSVPICNRSHARRANSGKITISLGAGAGTRLRCRHSRRISSPSGTKFPHKKLDTLRCRMVKTRSLYLTRAPHATQRMQHKKLLSLHFGRCVRRVRCVLFLRQKSMQQASCVEMRA